MIQDWWKRVKDRLQSRPAAPGTEAPSDDLWVEPDLNKDPAVATEPETPGALGRWIQRRHLALQAEQFAEQLNQTNEKLLAAVEKLHQASQDGNARLQDLIRNQDQFIGIIDRHGKAIEQMGMEMQRLTAAADQLTAALEALPKSSREQAEKLSAIEDQLQSDDQVDRALLGSMDTLGRNVAALARFAETQQAGREEFAKNLAQQIQPLIDFSRRQGRIAKIGMTLGVLILLALLGNLAVVIVEKIIH